MNHVGINGSLGLIVIWISPLRGLSRAMHPESQLCFPTKLGAKGQASHSPVSGFGRTEKRL